MLARFPLPSMESTSQPSPRGTATADGGGGGIAPLLSTTAEKMVGRDYEEERTLSLMHSLMRERSFGCWRIATWNLQDRHCLEFFFFWKSLKADHGLPYYSVYELFEGENKGPIEARASTHLNTKLEYQRPKVPNKLLRL